LQKREIGWGVAGGTRYTAMMTDPARRTRLVGYAALLTTVAIWGAWIVLTHQAVTHSLPPSAIALLRMIAPTILLAPAIWRAGIFARGKIVPLIFCIVGAGTPFVLLTATGMQYASAADFAALVPGTMPLFVALLSALIFKERMGWLRALGFACCSAGVFAIAGRSLAEADASTSFGHLLLLLASLNYAGYTLGFRASGLTPIEATGIVAFWSLLMILPFGTMPVIEALQAGHVHEIVFQAVLQGVLSGIVALVAFNTGIDRLGASKGAAFVALVPVVATLLAIPILGEWPDLAAIVGVATTSLGVLLASGILATAEKSDRKSAG
jgi:drug/metabolite transporter (DMT)-like permease